MPGYLKGYVKSSFNMLSLLLFFKFDLYFFLIALCSHVTATITHWQQWDSSQLQLSMPPTFSVLCSVCQKFPELVFKMLSFCLKIQKPPYPSLLTVFNFTSMISKPGYKQPWKMSQKSVPGWKEVNYADQKSWFSSQRAVKAVHHLNPVLLNHFTCFQHTSQCSVVLSMQKVSFRLFPATKLHKFLL